MRARTAFTRSAAFCEACCRLLLAAGVEFPCCGPDASKLASALANSKASRTAWTADSVSALPQQYIAGHGAGRLTCCYVAIPGDGPFEMPGMSSGRRVEGCAEAPEARTAASAPQPISLRTPL